MGREGRKKGVGKKEKIILIQLPVRGEVIASQGFKMETKIMGKQSFWKIYDSNGRKIRRKVLFFPPIGKKYDIFPLINLPTYNAKKGLNVANRLKILILL